MLAMSKHKQTAFGLIAVALTLLAVAVWLFVDRPPMGPPGPPPEGPERFQDFPGGPPPEPFVEEPNEHRLPIKVEHKIALVGILAVFMTLCIVAAVRLFKTPKAPQALTPIPTEPDTPVQLQKEAPTSISFKSDYKTITVQLDDIRYIESMSEYVKIYLDSQADPLIVLYSLKRLVEELPASRFMRIHRSYIIALNRIRQANASSVVLEAPVTTLPVGESYRPAFRKFLAEK